MNIDVDNFPARLIDPGRHKIMNAEEAFKEGFVPPGNLLQNQFDQIKKSSEESVGPLTGITDEHSLAGHPARELSISPLRLSSSFQTHSLL